MPNISTALSLKPEELSSLLQEAFPGSVVEVRDDTHLHEGHNEAVGHSGGHYKVKMIWAGFAGLSPMAAHRAVNAAVKAAWDEGRIHALTLKVLTPEQAA